MGEGRLYVCATPIGNLGDTSARLTEVLKAVDVVYAEDTRRAAILLGHIGARPRVRSLFAGNEKGRADQLISDVAAGLQVALISDAGTPSISDPGAEAVRRALEEGLAMTVIPGPSAVTAALAVSGLGGDRFAFEGFLPRKGRQREQRLAAIAAEDRPVVLFISPHRLEGDLEDLRAALGDRRRIVLARELTKLHEEVWAGSTKEAVERWAGEVKGEITVVVAPAAGSAGDVAGAVSRARLLVEEGISVSDAARQVAEEAGVSRRAVYQALIDDQR